MRPDVEFIYLFIYLFLFIYFFGNENLLLAFVTRINTRMPTVE